MKPKFKVGFELEGTVSMKIAPTDLNDLSYDDEEADDAASEDAFWTAIRKIPGYKTVVPGCDGHSVEKADHQQVEIRTPPLAISGAWNAFEDLCSYLTALARRGLWHTHSGCGLHCSISEQNLFKTREGYYKFMEHFIQAFPEWAVAEAFEREANTWGVINFERNIPKETKDLSTFWSRHGTVSYPYLRPTFYDEVRDRRLEIRCMGNDNYESNTRALKLLKDSVTSAMQEAFAASIRDKRHLVGEYKPILAA